ncbi:MAG: cytochrome c biogenesis protein CcsA [Bacteroidota bacterium]
MFLVLSFVTSLMAAVSYFFSVREPLGKLKSSWINLGRTAFIIHGISVFSIIGILLYVMINEYYEYNYVWHHVSDDLDFKYIFSALWEGQEGSFLLWMFWHVVLGFILIKTAKEWEGPVLSIMAAVQFFISSMIVGLYFYMGDSFFKVGVNPMLLLRDVQEAPIFQNPDYVRMIKGNGLNPLLQNYWMTIHPPTTFLGFASTLVPFSFAVAGLWLGKHKEWITAVLPWALFSGFILGLGILMGGVWAYEALSFGGYWAWDPVENMSLVPWLILVGGIHTALVAKSTGYSIRSTYLFFIFTFVLILYSTFLVRSGVLGETSVHAFTEMGLEWQLVIFILFFLTVGLGLYFRKAKEIPEIQREESLYSREFWMFIGALVLVFSSVLISHTTSIPVYSKIFSFIYDLTNVSFLATAENWSPPEDVVGHHNKYQIWIAVFIATLSATVQFLHYKKQDWKGKTARSFTRYIGVSLIGAIAVSALISWAAGFNAWQLVIFLVAAWFTIIANVLYMVFVLRNNVKLAGSVLSHVGFGILLIGILFTGVKKQILSRDFMSVGVIEGFQEEDERSNILLRKGLPTRMGDYMVTYMKDTVDRRQRTFEVNFKRFDEAGTLVEEFNLNPNVLYDKAKTKIEASNPSTKHYLAKDIFTHVSALPNHEVDPEATKNAEDTLSYKPHIIAIGDTFYTSKHYVVFENFNQNPKHPEYVAEKEDIAVGAKLVVHKLDTAATWTAEPVYLIRGSMALGLDDSVDELGLKFKFMKIDPLDQTVTIEVAETAPKEEYIVLQALLFPWINLVWLGSLMMLFGMFVSMFKRLKEKRMLA